MNDSDILKTVNRLAAEEHVLETKASRTALSEQERARLQKMRTVSINAGIFCVSAALAGPLASVRMR